MQSRYKFIEESESEFLLFSCWHDHHFIINHRYVDRGNITLQEYIYGVMIKKVLYVIGIVKNKLFCTFESVSRMCMKWSSEIFFPIGNFFSYLLF